MLVRIFILEPGHIDILLCELVFDRRGNLSGILFTVRCDTHIEPAEFAFRDSQAFHALAVDKEECQVHELRWRYKGMTDEPGDWQDAFLIIDLEDNGVPD